MENLKAILKSERGIVLAISLLILTLLVAGAAGAIVSTQLDLNTTGNLRAGRHAFYIAEAGLHQTWRELDRGQDSNNFEAVFTRAMGIAILSNVSFGGGNYTVMAEQIPGTYPRRIKATSLGCFPAADPCPSGHSRVIIEAHFIREPLFPCVLCGKEGINISGGAITDSFDSRDAPYNLATAGNRADVLSNGDITLSGATTLIKGNAVAGGTVIASEGAIVRGRTTDNVSFFSFPPVIPCGPPFSSPTGITGGNYDPLTGQLRGTGSDDIILANGNYCFSSVELNGNSTLTVSGPVTLSLTGTSSITAGGIVNTTANAENLKIVTSLLSSDLGIKIAGGDRVYLTLYAPDARVEVTGGGDFYGAIAAKNVVSTDGAKFHYDTRLKDHENGRVKMVFWREML